MSNESDTNLVEAPAPAADLKTLGDRLVGAWTVSGEAEGETTWEWMEGGFFLIQRGWTRRDGAEQKYPRSSAMTGFSVTSPPRRSPVGCTPIMATRSRTCAS
jgi:hypothetical protein